MKIEDILEPYKIIPIDKLSAGISYLICTMVQARRDTIASVNNLTQSELDFIMDKGSNSIGALLAHMAAVEKWYQAVTFENREIEGEELKSIDAALDLGEKAREEIMGKELTHYLNELELTRKKTIIELRKRNEEWLYEEHLYTKNEKANNFFLWFHVVEDEINHRGQINLIKKRIPR